MFVLAAFLLIAYGAGMGEGQAGSPWNTEDNDYYYDPLNPDDTLPIILSSSQNFTVDVHSKVTFPCRIQNMGEFSVIWRNGTKTLWVLQERSDGPFMQKVNKDSRISREGTSLVLTDVRLKDQSNYTCEVSTQPSRLVVHTLTVTVPPMVYPANNRSVVTIKMGKNVNLGCNASGKPPPTVTWTVKGKLDILGSGPKLSLPDSKPDYNGVYRCTVDNGYHKSVYTDITLKIMFSPKVTAEIPEVYSGVGYSATLACIVHGEPEPQVKWYRNLDVRNQYYDSPVDPLRLIQSRFDASQRYTLHFDIVQRDDLGEYSCNATNYMGNASAMIRLTARPKPVKCSSSKFGENDSSYTLVWDVESYVPILEYNLAYRNDSDTDDHWVNFTVPAGTTSSSIYYSKSHTFTDLDGGATYHVLVSARNEFGESDVGDVCTFTTLELAVTKIPEDLEAEGGEDTVLIIDQYEDVVSEMDDSQAEPPSYEEERVHDLAASGGNLTEGKDHLKEEVPVAEKSAVHVNTSAGFRLTPQEKRAQMAALVTAISLSSFFL